VHLSAPLTNRAQPGFLRDILGQRAIAAAVAGDISVERADGLAVGCEIWSSVPPCIAAIRVAHSLSLARVTGISSPSPFGFFCNDACGLKNPRCDRSKPGSRTPGPRDPDSGSPIPDHSERDDQRGAELACQTTSVDKATRQKPGEHTMVRPSTSANVVKTRPSRRRRDGASVAA
jgi:hypothetical protein